MPLGKKKFNEEGDTTTLRCIKAFHEPQYIRTHMSVAAMFLGERSRLEKAMFNIGAKNRDITGLLWGCWWFGCSVSLLTLLDFFPVYFTWTSLLMLPLPMVTLPVLSEDLTKCVLADFQFYVLLAGNFWIFYCALQIQGGQLAWLFWICAYPTILIAPLVDAYPPRFRTFFAKHFFFGIICITLVWLIVIFDTRTIPLRIIDSKFGEHYSNNYVSQTLTAAVGLIGFCNKYLYTVFFHPSEFVILQVPLLTSHVDFVKKFEQAGDGQTHLFLERRGTKVRIPLGEQT